MTKIKNEDLIWVRPDIKFDGDYVAGNDARSSEEVRIAPPSLRAFQRMENH